MRLGSEGLMMLLNTLELNISKQGQGKKLVEDTIWANPCSKAQADYGLFQCKNQEIEPWTSVKYV